jgi:hypothetical protein
MKCCVLHLITVVNYTLLCIIRYYVVLPICIVVYCVLYSMYVLTGVISYVLHCVCTSLFSVCVS